MRKQVPEELVRLVEDYPIDLVHYRDKDFPEKRETESPLIVNLKVGLLLVLMEHKPCYDFGIGDCIPYDAPPNGWSSLRNFDIETETLKYDDAWGSDIKDLAKKLNLPYHLGRITSTKELSEKFLSALGRPKEELESTRDYLDSNGNFTRDPYVEMRDFLIAKDNVWLKRMIQAQEAKDTQEIGRCYGYPETAVTITLETGGADGSLYDRLPIVKTVNFGFSKEHWREEFEVLKEWDTSIKEVSPLLYEQLENNSV